MANLKPGWRRVKFSQLAECINDRVDDPVKAGVERYVGLEHLDPKSLAISRWGTPDEVESTKLRFRPGDIIFGKRRAYQRKLAVADFDGICSAHAMVLRAKPDVVLSEFLPFLMHSDTFMERAVAISVGSLSPTINWKTLADEEFTLPPMEEQRRLLQVLLAANDAQHAASTASNRAHATQAAFVEESLTSLRRSYPDVLATDVLDRLTVGIVVKPTNWYTNDSTGVPALRSLNIRPGSLMMDDLVRITIAGHKFHEKSQLQAGDVVVVRTGRPGEATVIPEEIGPLNCIDLIITTPKQSLDPEYFATVLNSAFGKRIFLAGATGTAQQHFNVSAFKRLRLPFPPREVQAKLVSEVNLLRKSELRLIERASQLATLSKALLNEASVK